MNREEQSVDREAQGFDAALHPALKLRLARERIFFGPGPAELLMQIKRTDSVRMACEQMGISYSKGWKMINTMEEELGYKVTKTPAGRKERRQCLSDTGGGDASGKVPGARTPEPGGCGKYFSGAFWASGLIDKIDLR